LVESIFNDNDNGGFIPNQQLNQSRIVNGFTLFFFVDATNIQSLNAISKVSYWFHVVLSNRQQEVGNEGRVGTTNNSRVICITNHPSVEELEEDIIGQEEDTVTIGHIHTSSKAVPSNTVDVEGVPSVVVRGERMEGRKNRRWLILPSSSS
jgi:hypothetical protein